MFYRLGAGSFRVTSACLRADGEDDKKELEHRKKIPIASETPEVLIAQDGGFGFVATAAGAGVAA
jgi:hypothetical protein